MKSIKRVALVLVVAITCLAADKVGYLNMNSLFEGYYKTVVANISFEQKKLEFDERLGVLGKGLEELVRELKKLEDEARNELLAESVREEAFKKYRARAEIFSQRRAEFERERRKVVQELRVIQEKTESELVAELRKLVNEYASANGYTHIIDISGNTMNRIPVFLVYPENEEITKVLVELSNKDHEKELEEAKAKLEELRKPKK